MKNYKKYENFKYLYSNLNKSLSNRFWLEAINIEYSIFEDRLAALLCILGEKVYSSPEREISLQEKLKKTKALQDSVINTVLTDELLDRIVEWKNERNKIAHRFVLCDMAETEAERVAVMGNNLLLQFKAAIDPLIKKYKQKNKYGVLYKLGKDCYIRQWGDFGYIRSVGLENDLLFDINGAKFLSALSDKPQKIAVLAERVAKQYTGVKAKDIINDVMYFYDILCENGFAVKGYSDNKIKNTDIGFAYKNITESYIKEDFTPRIKMSDADSQVRLDEFFTKSPTLVNFQFELTSKCNERCIHCYIPHEYKNTDIDPKLFYKTLNQLAELGTLSVTLSGGEPMMHPKFLDFLKASKKKGFYVHVLSNLNLLSDDIVKEMRKGNTCAVQASLYSMNPEHHDTITTVKGSFERTKNGIIKLIENNIPVQINCPVMKANKDDVADVIRWGHEHKIRVNIDYAIMAEYDHCTNNLANRLSPEECRDVIKAIIREDSDYEKLISSEEFTYNCSQINIDSDEPFCGVGINTCCMVANGNVYPCAGWQEYVCGNLCELPLKEIWQNSEPMQKLRALRKKDIPQCLKCENRAFCSPCLARFANESKSGNYLEVAQHFCNVAEVNREVVTEWINNK